MSLILPQNIHCVHFFTPKIFIDLITTEHNLTLQYKRQTMMNVMLSKLERRLGNQRKHKKQDTWGTNKQEREILFYGTPNFHETNSCWVFWCLKMNLLLHNLLSSWIEVLFIFTNHRFVLMWIKQRDLIWSTFIKSSSKLSAWSHVEQIHWLCHFDFKTMRLQHKAATVNE